MWWNTFRYLESAKLRFTFCIDLLTNKTCIIFISFGVWIKPAKFEENLDGRCDRPQRFWWRRWKQRSDTEDKCCENKAKGEYNRDEICVYMMAFPPTLPSTRILPNIRNICKHTKPVKLSIHQSKQKPMII